ncbi:hypothetical protein [Bacillus sp. AK128]
MFKLKTILIFSLVINLILSTYLFLQNRQVEEHLIQSSREYIGGLESVRTNLEYILNNKEQYVKSNDRNAFYTTYNELSIANETWLMNEHNLNKNITMPNGLIEFINYHTQQDMYNFLVETHRQDVSYDEIENLEHFYQHLDSFLEGLNGFWDVDEDLSLTQIQTLINKAYEDSTIEEWRT